MIERAARMVFGIAVLMIVAAMLCGCSLQEVQYPFGAPEKPAENPPEDIEINLNAAAPARPAVKKPDILVESTNNQGVTLKGAPIDVPAPELENVNRYARALEAKLRQRYNNTPNFAGRVGKVQLLPVGEPQVSLDGKKMRIEWSQVVFDEWGKRIPELEKEFYVVTFGDGKPLMQRTRPSITVGLNNEGGYSEYAPIRGGKLSTRSTVGSPEMFDRPASERTGMLDDNLESKNSAPDATAYLDLPTLQEAAGISNEVKNQYIPVIKPVGEHLSAVVVDNR